MDCINCSICAEKLDDAFTHTLNCNHVFHYECLMLSFKHIKNTFCPICRSPNNLLPLVNGLKKIHNGIHDMKDWEVYENKKCLHILHSGKNKGKQCSRFCKIGMNYCLIHINKHKEIEDNNIIENGNK